MGLLDDNLDINKEVLERVMIKDIINNSDYYDNDSVSLDNMIYKKPRKVKDPWMYVLTVGLDDGKYLVKWEHARRITWRRATVYVNHYPIYLREFQKFKESYNI